MRKRILLLLLIGSGVACLDLHAQSFQQIERALQELDGGKALFLINQMEVMPENQGLLLDYQAEAWRLIGNDKKQALFAKEAVKHSSVFKTNLEFHLGRPEAYLSMIQSASPQQKSSIDAARQIRAFLMTSEDTEKILEKIDGYPPAFRQSAVMQILKAEAHIKMKAFDQARAMLTSLNSHSSPAVQARSLFLTGRIELAQNELDKALEGFNKAQKRYGQVFGQRGQSASYIEMGLIKARQGDFVSAKQLGKKAAGLARAIGNLMLEYRANNLLSWAYFGSQEDFGTVLLHQGRQAELVEQLGDGEKASVYNNLGYNLTIAGTVALDSLQRMMNFVNDTYAKMENTEGRWYTLMNLTWIHRLKGEIQQSEHYARKALDRARAIKDRHAIIETSFQLGETLSEQGRLEEARTYYQEGLEQRGDQKDRDAYVFDVYYARFLWLSGNRVEAIRRLEVAIEFLINSEVFYEMHARALLADYYFQLGQFQRAREQVDTVENPRSAYIAFESRSIIATVHARLSEKEGHKSQAESILYNYLSQAEQIGALQLKDLIVSTLSSLN